MVGRNGIEQQAFNDPNQNLCGHQGDQIVLKEEAQSYPQQILSNQVATNTCQKDRLDGFLSPTTVPYDDYTLDDESY